MHTTIHNHNTVELHVEADSNPITHMNQKQTGEKLTITKAFTHSVTRNKTKGKSNHPVITGDLAGLLSYTIQEPDANTEAKPFLRILIPPCAPSLSASLADQ